MTLRKLLRTVPILALALLGAGCSDALRSPVEPSGLQPSTPAAALTVVETVDGTVGGTVEALIGPGGGVLDLGDGHSLVFPAGALSETVLISAERDPSRLAASFAPHGLTFPADASPTLTFRYTAGTTLTDADATSLSIVYLNGDGEVTEVLGGTIDTDQDQIATPIRHFSTYAVATN